jgi:hypothetical protein
MTKEAIDRRSEDAFARSTWLDPRADYRDLLRRLKESDTAAFASAVREYEAAVVERLADPAADPVAAWLGYGVRLAGWLGGGRTVEIDAAGRAAEMGAIDRAERATLLLHLPAAEGARAIVIASPREPSEAQRATLALLVEGRAAL